MMRKLAIVLFASIAITAACGGGGGSSRDLFVEQANQLCTALSDSYKAGKANLPSPPTAADTKEFVQGSFAPQAITTYQQIGALPMPDAEKDDLQSLLTAAIAEVKLIQSDPATNGTPLTQRELVRRFQAAGLTACGVGFQHELDKPQFVKEVNDICSALTDKLHTSARSLGVVKDSPPEVVIAFVQGFASALYRAAVSEVERLGFPAGDEATLQQLLADWRADIDAVEQDPPTYNQARPLGIDVGARWVAYGADACSELG
jgi:hypothetical protein